jgi:hypothetical protein
MPYQPIENYGIIDNMRTVALVGMNGPINRDFYLHFRFAQVGSCTNSNFLCYNSGQSMDRCSASR